MQSVLKQITSNYPFFLKTKDGYYTAYSHKIDDNILDELTELNKLYSQSYKRFVHKNNYDTVYVIGDIHADYISLIDILLKQQFIIKTDDYYDWNPEIKNTCIIQIGDFLHGYGKQASPQTYQFFHPGELEIVRLFKHLIKTEKNGNKLVVLLGNHEFMNLMQKYNTGKVLYANELYQLLDQEKEEKEINDFILENCEVCCVINDFLFTHAGITKQMIQKIFGFLRFPRQCYNKLDEYTKFKIINIVCIAYINKIYKENKKCPINKDLITQVCLKVFYTKIKIQLDKTKSKMIIEDNDADLKYLLTNSKLLNELLNDYFNDTIRYSYSKKLKTYDKIDAMFRNNINELFAYHTIFEKFSEHAKYIKLLFSSSISNSARLLNNYFFSLNDDNFIIAKEHFLKLCEELGNIKGMIVGHSPQKNIIYSFDDTTKKILINIDNLISIGVNQKDVIRQINYDGTIIFKRVKILMIKNTTLKEIAIDMDIYKLLYVPYDRFKPTALISITLE